MKHLFYCLYFLILIYIVWLMPTDVKSAITVNLFPLQTIHLYMTALLHGYAPLSVIFANILGNIMLTIPIGCFLYSSIPKLSIWEVLFFSIYIPCYIEFVQLLLHIIGYGTRSIDIDDVLLNMIGIWIGVYGAIIKQWKLNRTFK